MAEVFLVRSGTESERVASENVETREVHKTTDRGEAFIGEDPIMRAIPNGTGFKCGVVNLSPGDESKAVAFTNAFGAAPTLIEVQLLIPNGGAVFHVAVDHSTITASGFTAIFGAAVPGSGTYKLQWKAYK